MDLFRVERYVCEIALAPVPIFMKRYAKFDGSIACGLSLSIHGKKLVPD